MREKRKRTVSQPETWYWKWRTGYDSKTFLNACGSLLITTFFALYNGFLGVMHASPWHGSICVYYLLLAVLRFSILMMERHARRQENAEAERGRLKIYLVCA
ncbi:MAG: hypothetical protein IJ088_11835, partial [Clostridia bacterium]|nr:hypothetical protein [Clostridia bacterium]